ncbi:YdeI/OmpD-associated family protein [Oryzihumus sp.]
MLEWVGAARREQTRQTRIAETVAKARENLRANQWRQQGGR